MTMQYQIFVQSHSDRQYTASIVGIPDCTVEASTKDEAILKAKAALEERLASGELVTIEIPAQPTQIDHSRFKHFGIFADDSTFDDFLVEVSAYRQQIEAQEQDL